MIRYLLKVYDDVTDEVIFVKDYPRSVNENKEEFMEQEYRIREDTIYKFMNQLTIEDLIDSETKSVEENPELYDDKEDKDESANDYRE